MILQNKIEKEHNFKKHRNNFKTHYRHEDDIEHLHKYQNQINISSTFILRLSSKIKLQTVQDSIGGELKRIDLITRKDITNIKLSYGIDLKDGYMYNDDATGVYFWVECLQTHVQYYFTNNRAY
ncbi:uncharacterized protein LOC126889726 [Diabrotica virgifera virgifera]|uniref:Uncharacterized protein n=1 Tax=Diabrotica virgifera virgifera TaxID=50390 RepID=A0ABM5KVM4_DIAVI|nr:uncharacterized protein LOC126889726 [Diabrotica virgifera virgifera]